LASVAAAALDGLLDHKRHPLLPRTGFSIFHQSCGGRVVNQLRCRHHPMSLPPGRIAFGPSGLEPIGDLAQTKIESGWEVADLSNEQRSRRATGVP